MNNIDFVALDFETAIKFQNRAIHPIAPAHVAPIADAKPILSS